eukprot:5239686-Pyramimonas_sp.AAC.1
MSDPTVPRASGEGRPVVLPVGRAGARPQAQQRPRPQAEKGGERSPPGDPGVPRGALREGGQLLPPGHPGAPPARAPRGR